MLLEYIHSKFDAFKNPTQPGDLLVGNSDATPKWERRSGNQFPLGLSNTLVMGLPSIGLTENDIDAFLGIPDPRLTNGEYLAIAGRGIGGQRIVERVTLDFLTPVYDLISSGHAAEEYINLGSITTLTDTKAIDALTIEGTLSTTTGAGVARNLNGLFFKMVDADNGAGDHRVRGILGSVSTAATAGTIGHKATAIQGTAIATGSSDADLSGVTGEVTSVASTTAGHAWSILATETGTANKATGLALGGTDWFRGLDFASFITSISDSAIFLANGATSGKIKWNDSQASYIRGGVTNGILDFGALIQMNEITGVYASEPTGTSGTLGVNVTATQTSPNAGDTGDSAFGLSWTLSANSATNELVARIFNFGMVNSLTGGGHLQNARQIDLVFTASASTTTDELSFLYFDAIQGAGTVTTAIALNLSPLGTTPFIMKVPTDNTDPTGGGGAATGRIKIQDASGNTRYIPYYA